MSRVDGGQHRSVSGAISARFGHDQIDKMVNSLAGQAGNGHWPLCGSCFAAVLGIEKIDFVYRENFALARLRVSGFA